MGTITTTIHGEAEGRAGSAQDSTAQKGPPVIYSLSNEAGAVFYVGRTTAPASRLHAHKTIHGQSTTMTILQASFRNETPGKAEVKWIQRFLKQGTHLLNKQVDVAGDAGGYVKLRVDTEEYAMFMNEAMAAGLSLSCWIRTHLRIVCRRNGLLRDKLKRGPRK